MFTEKDPYGVTVLKNQGIISVEEMEEALYQLHLEGVREERKKLIKDTQEIIEKFRDFPIKVKAKGLSQGEKEAYITGFNRMLETTLEVLEKLKK